MADPKNDDFLDDLAAMEAEEQAEEQAELEPEAIEVDSLRAERDEYRDRYMRALAEAENARKRSDRSRREAEQYGGSKLARDVLPVYDNMNGITRQKVIDLCRDNGIPVFERNYSLVDTYGADEAFLTGTFGAQTPVGEIDGRQIGTGEMGPMTERIRSLYKDLIDKECA